MSETILITGATGTIGTSLVEQMARQNVKAKALVRNPAKAEAIRTSNLELVTGDFEKPETLGHALEGVDRLFLNSSPDPRIVELQCAVIEAARHADVRHIVKLSAVGAGDNPPVALIRWHREIELEVENSGLSYTHLRPNGFMQNSFMFAETICQQGAFYAAMGQARVSWIDARDIASVALSALTEEGHEGRVYELTGPEALSYEEMAHKFSSALGTEVRYVDVPDEAARAGMIEAGLPAWLADALIELSHHYREGGATRAVTTDVSDVLGRRATTFDQFLRDHTRAFVRREPD
jgi:uncharacterized protein YbjT (DUF2867 family)